MDAPKNQKRVLIIAGEASGDQHGAKLVHAMQERMDGLYFYGIGGPAMRAAGVRVLVDAGELSVVGFTEVYHKLGGLIESTWLMEDLLDRVRPHLVVLIDFPDFNMRIAKKARKRGIKVLYYISPQVWAWRVGRVKKIKKWVDHMAVILPFEKEFYEKHGVPVTFVGHPLLDTRHAPALSPPPDHPDTDPLIGLIPGSRHGEVTRHLPIMLEAGALIQERIPGARFAIPVADTLDPGLIQGLVDEARAGGKAPGHMDVLPGGIGKVLNESAAAITVSGTVTLEAALSGTPMVIIYRLSAFTYRLARALIRVDFVGLANLIAGTRVAPELLQGEANPRRIADEVLAMLENPEALKENREKLKKLRERLGGEGASKRTAAVAEKLLFGTEEEKDEKAEKKKT